MQFGGVLERLILFHRPVLLGFCLRVPGAVFVGFTGSWDYAVLARWLHVFLEYLEIDTIAFLSAPGRTAVEGGWPWRRDGSPSLPQDSWRLCNPSGVHGHRATCG